MERIIYLIGVGNYTEVIIELARDCGYEVKGLYHYNEDRIGDTVLGVKILASTQSLFNKNLKGKNFAVTIGNNAMRQNVAEKIRQLEGETPSLIHPKAEISSSASLGQGCFVFSCATLWTQSKIGNDCIISPKSIVSHHASVGNACSIASLSIIGTYCKIGNRVLFGMNSLILPHALSLGNDCIIGAKANVTKSYKSNSVLVGNPARPKSITR
ncbi:NeuD/PglB/VioB family sugar acetyltransferase [Algibacter mikhailovii]|uniref:NeuD/PglB/VioB family sugar acetyltransferase n=1 Tax=Algibacter mikhailovii TaxID=425498 RepID=UPI0024940AFC|nr:NeuD/PglB/VioB family sugar acetyltransferase [Algibacter mikhailovii]